MCNASVVICTYNRAESLRRTLQTCCELVIPQGTTWELLVVDNNSTDHTKQVCDSFSGKLPIRYLHEMKQGQSAARNRGVVESRSDLLMFTDDDVDISPSWLFEMYTAAQQHPEIAIFGGPIFPKWEVPPPKWVLDNLGKLLTNVHLDWGSDSLLITLGDDRFFAGANMAYRRAVLTNGFAFREDIGVKGRSLSVASNLRGEEIELQQQLRLNGCQSFYVATAPVYHRHPPERQTESYVRAFYMGMGAAAARQAPPSESTKTFLGAPQYLWRVFLSSAMKYGFTRWCASSRTWLPAECRMASTWGQIVECRRRSCLDQEVGFHKNEKPL